MIGHTPQRKLELKGQGLSFIRPDPSDQFDMVGPFSLNAVKHIKEEKSVKEGSYFESYGWRLL